ncbi:MAG: hypothetical protein WA913_10885, partial [Pricia sp.]
SFSIAGLTENQGSVQSELLSLYFAYYENIPENIQFGYLDDVDNYRSDLKFRFEEYYYSYSKIGSAISTFAIPPVIGVDVSNEKPNDFQFTVDAPYNYHSVEFRASESFTNGNTTYWSVISPSGSSVKLVTLPEELLEESELYMVDFEYNGMTLHTKSREYDEEIKINIRGLSDNKTKREVEFFSVYPSNGDTAKKSYEQEAIRGSEHDFIKSRYQSRFSEVYPN